MLLGVYGETPSTMIGCNSRISWKRAEIGEWSAAPGGGAVDETVPQSLHSEPRRARFSGRDDRWEKDRAPDGHGGAVPLHGKSTSRIPLNHRSALLPCLRHSCAIFAAVALILAASLFFGGAAAAQNMDKPVQTVDEEVTAFAYALDGRIAYSVRHMYKAKKYDLERDDIFMMDTNGKRKKIFSGEKFSTGDKPLTYLIESFTWSPNSKVLAVQMNTITVDH